MNSQSYKTAHRNQTVSENPEPYAIRTKPRVLPEAIFNELMELAGLDEIADVDRDTLQASFEELDPFTLSTTDDIVAVKTMFRDCNTGHELLYVA